MEENNKESVFKCATPIEVKTFSDPVKFTPEKLRLRPGKFYYDRTGFVWCCFRIEPGSGAAHERAACVRISDARVDVFYEDGRFDFTGTSSFSLVREVPDEVKVAEVAAPIIEIE